MTALRCTGLLFAMVVMIGRSPAQTKSDEARARLTAIVRSIDSGGLSSVDIFGLPPDALFRTNITPDILERIWDYKLTVRGLAARMEPRAEELKAVLNSDAVQSTAAKLDFIDVRWGLVFYSKASGSTRLVSVYFDKSGRSGAVDNIPVSFGPDFLPRLRRALHSSIEQFGVR